ncbi:MAG: 4'-phosphopantetheinyl transferase superfamily protein [Fulvivirga sp.]|nr:4'-phosphopantetheinyl transferase superfamily protein [Fulvivirga sp.]
MPVYKTIQVSSQRTVCIWRIEETFEQMLSQLNPNKEDYRLLHSFKSSKKQLEWLAGRLTLKHLCQNLNIRYSGVVKDAHGKPSLRSHPHEISLTHSFPYVAAIIDSNLPVGIDLEQPKSKIVKIAPKFLNNKELRFGGQNAVKLNMMWCIKETLYKIYGKKGLIFKKHLDIQPFNEQRDKLIVGNIIANSTVESYKLAFMINSEYILTYNV